MSFRRLALAAAVVALAAARSGLAHAETVTEWKSVASGSGEVSPGQEFDLDFGSLTQSKAEFRLERTGDGIYWIPFLARPGMGCNAAVASGGFETFDLAKSLSMNLSLDRIYLCGGEAPPVAPGTVLVVATCDGNTAKVVIDECGSTLKFRYATYRKETVTKVAQPGALTAPALKCPPDGVVFEHDPRVVLLAWGSVPGAASYDLEVDCKGCCGPRREFFCTEQENGKVFISKKLTTPSFDTIWLGAYPGRWRTRAVKADGATGPWTNWFDFTFAK